MSSWCHHESSAEPLITSGLPHCYLSLLSFLFTLWLTHQTLDSAFMWKRIKEGSKGQSHPSLSPPEVWWKDGGGRWLVEPGPQPYPLAQKLFSDPFAYKCWAAASSPQSFLFISALEIHFF